MNKVIKDAAVLALITLVAGLMLGFFYELTKNPIEAQEELTKQNSYQAVFPDAQSFEEYTFDLEEAAQILEEAGYPEESIQEVMLAKDSAGETLGYALNVVTSEGYSGDITFVMGVQMDGTLNGIAFLSISETAGLGMKAKESEFKDQFADKNVDSFAYSKTGAEAENEIDAISGATITTNAVTNGVNAGLAYVHSITEGGSANE